MGCAAVKLILEQVRETRGDWQFSADATFLPGIHLVTGRVGSGKSTLAGIAAGMLLPGSGRVLREGISSGTRSLQYPEYHVTGATLAKEAASYGVSPEEALENAGLSGRGEDDPFILSRGELKRFHLSCLSLRRWDLLVLDEPFSALDCRGKKRECERIPALSPGIVLVCTHAQQHLPRTDFLWEMRDGNLHALGKVPDALPFWQTAPKTVRTLVSQGCVPANLTDRDLEEALCRMRD
jgi:energy-coupling factor transport system ATP-binding protein